MEDVTDKLLKDISITSRNTPVGKRLLSAKPAKVLDDRLMAVIEELRKPKSDVTMGYVSGPLLYSSFIRYKAANMQSAIFRMLKGRFLVIVEHRGKPAEGTYAYRDSRYGDRYYEIAMNPEKF